MQIGSRVTKFVISSEGMPLAEHVFCGGISRAIILGDFLPDKQHRSRNILSAIQRQFFVTQNTILCNTFFKNSPDKYF